MSDEEIAYLLVKAGVLGTETMQGVMLYTFPGNPHLCPPETWLSDWNVAGECLERLAAEGGGAHTTATWEHYGGTMPHAICEAFATEWKLREEQ